MMALGYRLDAERMRLFLRDEIIRQSHTEGGHSYVLREFGACWDAALVSSVIDLIEQEIRHPQTLRDLIDYLAEHDSPAAYRAWTRLRRRHRRTPEPAAFAAATAALAGFHLLTFCELQIQHNKRPDIEVSAVAVGSDPRHQRAIQLVIEVKGHWHPEVKSAHQTQLVRDYLQGCGRTHGIYLVVWTRSDADPRRSPLKAKSPEEAQTALAALLAPYDGKQNPETLRPLVLDARPG